MTGLNRLIRTTLPVFLLAFAVAAGGAQEMPGMGASSALASQSLRPYWHVFIAYAVAIVMVMLWAGSIAKRLADVERRLGE
jgi:hypothetical protein